MSAERTGRTGTCVACGRHLEEVRVKTPIKLRRPDDGGRAMRPRVTVWRAVYGTDGCGGASNGLHRVSA